MSTARRPEHTAANDEDVALANRVAEPVERLEAGEPVDLNTGSRRTKTGT